MLLRRNAEMFFIKPGKIIYVGKSQAFCYFAYVQLGIRYQVFCFIGYDTGMKSMWGHSYFLFEKVSESRWRYATQFGTVVDVEFNVFEIHSLDDFVKNVRDRLIIFFDFRASGQPD